MLNSTVQDSNGQETDPAAFQRLEDLKLPFWKKRRYHLVGLVFLGFINFYSLRVNLSIAIVAMTMKTNVTLENGTVVQEQEFYWNSKEEGLILSSVFYGSLLTQFIGGYLASRLGGHLIFGISIAGSSIISLLTPILAKTHLSAFIAARFILGLFQGMCFPAVMAIWSKWAPVYERSTMGNFTYTGIHIGGVVSLMLSGILSVIWGWESVFYFFGAIGCTWYFVWIFSIKANPEVDPFITEVEKKYIQSSVGNSNTDKPIIHPWKDIMTSSAVWAIIVADITAMYGLFTLLTQMPMYMNDILHFNINTTGIMLAIPYMVLIGLMFVAGFLADWLQARQYLSTEQIRKTFTSIPFIIQMAFMLLTAFTTNPTFCVLYLTLGVGVGAFPWSGYIVSGLDIAPSHVSVIAGICGTISIITGIISPMLMGFIVTDKTREQWQIVFFITAGVYLFGAVFCWFFMKGSLQTWAKIDQEKLKLTTKTNDNAREVGI